MSRIAAPMVGGMISSTVLTLAVIPALYGLLKQRELRRVERALARGGDVVGTPPEPVRTRPGSLTAAVPADIAQRRWR